MMRHLLRGFFFGFALAVFFSAFASVVICLGLDPETRIISDQISPLLGIFLGASIAARGTSWKVGAGTGISFVILWAGFWIYVMGRWYPLLWMEEALSRLTSTHLLWWGLALLSGIVGGVVGQKRVLDFFAITLLSCFGLLMLMLGGGKQSHAANISGKEPTSGFIVERQEPTPDGTVVYLLTFDFQKQDRFAIGLYDCDEDDAKPRDDSNTSYMGQGLETLVDKLSHRAKESQQKFLCVINGGFFGASGFSVAHHEEPLVQDGRMYYNVDLLRPKDQAWLFAVNFPRNIYAGTSRFAMIPATPTSRLGDYQMVLGGVRPLRLDGKSLALKPGAGSTTLKCSRTSVGWSADGAKFYILVAHNTNSEAAGQFRKQMHWPQMGGWDVGDVQKFWEQKQVPYALLFDGGESTQLGPVNTIDESDWIEFNPGWKSTRNSMEGSRAAYPGSVATSA